MLLLLLLHLLLVVLNEPRYFPLTQWPLIGLRPLVILSIGSETTTRMVIVVVVVAEVEVESSPARSSMFDVQLTPKLDAAKRSLADTADDAAVWA